MKIKFIAGPCVIESAELLDTVAQRLVAINERPVSYTHLTLPTNREV